MNKVRRVLVPTDFSPGAAPAVERGIDLTRQFGAELHLLHVALLADSSPMYPLFQTASTVEALYGQIHEASVNKLDELRDRIELPTPIQAEVKHAGAVAPTILRYASEHDIDLIAIGTHGWRGLRHFLLGSVAEEVVRDARCPVMTFRSEAERSARRPETILAAIDFAETSPEVVRSARRLGGLYHARVDFVHVVPDLAPPNYYESGHADEIVRRLPEIEASVLNELEALVLETGGDDCDMEYSIAHGRAFEAILERAEQKASDLIVMAARSVHELPAIRLGSTAERVVRRAPCPVLVVKLARTKTKAVAVREEASADS